MTLLHDPFSARWRRVERAVTEVTNAAQLADPTRCPDAVAGALDALYDLWELWSSNASLTYAAQNHAVRGRVNGETAAALIHARGVKTHAHVDFGDLTDTVAERTYDHFGSWQWQPHSDGVPRFAERDAWYAAHVSGHEVVSPFDAALRWMREVSPLPT